VNGSTLLFLTSFVLLCRVAGGDVFHLRSGGTLRGTWLNRDDAWAREYEIATPEGLTLRVAAADVATRERETPAKVEYERRAPHVAHTVEAQWELAQWCAEQGLKTERIAHLQNIIALEPNHARARLALGDVQINGQWQTSAEHHAEHGYQRLAGKWRTAPDVALANEAAQREKTEREWIMKLRRWRADLQTDKAAAAREQFQQLADPLALSALERLLRDEREPRLMPLYYDVLVRMNTAASHRLLLEVTLAAASPALFWEGFERLRKVPPQVLERPLLEALRSSDGLVIDRAAYVVGKTQSARLASPLIEALVTVQRVATGQQAGQTTSSFGSDGSIGLSRGGPAVIEVPVQHPPVLEALVALTGQNFGYDQRSWRLWYDIEKDRLLAR
jgi:hypothetical protein